MKLLPFGTGPEVPWLGAIALNTVSEGNVEPLGRAESLNPGRIAVQKSLQPPVGSKQNGRGVQGAYGDNYKELAKGWTTYCYRVWGLSWGSGTSSRL